MKRTLDDMLYYLIYNRLNKTSAAFRMKGPDANTYLQGQFTQEINRPIGSVGYGLFLNQKGKVVADGYVLRIGSEELLLANFSFGASKLRERLEAYLIADEVTIEDETELWVRISVWGDSAEAALGQFAGEAPRNAGWCGKQDFYAFRERSCAPDHFEILVHHPAVQAIADALGRMGAQNSDRETVERDRITRGIPSIPVDIGPNDLPNEGGLENLAISYTKGCYLGQEVMARLKNMGQVRRRLHLVRGTGEAPGSGSLLFQKERKVGDVRSAARDGSGFVAMAMLTNINLGLSGDLSLLPDGPANISIVRRV